MGFFGNLEKQYDDFQDAQIAKRKKNLSRLKEKAAILKEEAKYKAEINQAKKSNLDSFNNRMDSFSGAIIGGQGPKKKKPGEGIGKWL